MKIKQLSIRNFRSIQEEDIPVEGLSILVGANGCGKSNFLKALHYFYEPKLRVTRDDFFNRDMSSPIEILVVYDELTKEEVEHFSKYITIENELHVIKRFSAADNAGVYYGHIKGCAEFAKLQRKPVATYKDQYNALRAQPEFSSLPAAGTGPAMDEALDAWVQANPTKLTLIEAETQFFGFENSSAASLERFTKFVYIPAVMSENHLGDVKNGPIAELTDILARHKLQEDAEIKALKADIKQKFADKLRPFNVVEMTKLSGGLTATMQAYYQDVNVAITLDEEVADVTLPIPKALINIKEGGYESSLSSSGQGVQRAFVLSLLQYFAENKPKDDEDTDQFNLILGIDEPELYQHPSKQKLFYTVLKALAENGSTVAAKVQCCYTTHSPLMLGIDVFNSIIRVSKIPCGIGELCETKVFKATLSDLADQEATLPSRGSKFTDLKLLSGMINAIDSRINEGFFSKHVILVEGPSDLVALRAAAKYHSKGSFDLERNDIALISCGGKTNIEKPRIVFDALGIKTFTIWDGDYSKFEEVEKLRKRIDIAAEADKPGLEAKLKSKKDASDSAISKNRDLLSLNGETIADWPEHIGQASAAFKDTIEQQLKDDLGENYITDLVQKHNNMIQASGAWKNPIVMSAVLEEAFSTGKLSKKLDTIVTKIIEMTSVEDKTANEKRIDKAA